MAATRRAATTASVSAATVGLAECSDDRALLRTAYHADAYPGMGSGGLAADAYAGAADWDEEIWFFPAFNL